MFIPLLNKAEIKRRYGWPDCAVCGKPVESLEFAETHEDEWAITFIVRCHGQEQRVTYRPEI